MPQSPLSRVLPTSMGESTKTVLLSRRQLRDPAGDGSACGPRPRPTRTAPRTVKNLVRNLCGPWDLSAVGSGLPTGRGSRSKSPVMNSTTADTTDSGSSLAMALAAGRVTRNGTAAQEAQPLVRVPARQPEFVVRPRRVRRRRRQQPRWLHQRAGLGQQNHTPPTRAAACSGPGPSSPAGAGTPGRSRG